MAAAELFVGVLRVGLEPVVGRDAVGGRVFEVAGGAGLGGLQEAGVAAEAAGGAEAVEGPGARPRAQSESPRQPWWVLWRRNSPVSDIEDAFMGGAAVATHEVAARGEAVLRDAAQQVGVAGFLGGVEDDADVHHDVDEKALRPHEGGQVSALFAEARTGGSASLDEDAALGLVAVLVVPALPAGPEEEAEVMDAGVGHTVFDEAAVVDGALAEPWVAGLLVDEPELAGQEALAPVGPGLAAVQPLAALGVEREVIRMVGDEVAQLARGQVEGGLRAAGAGRRACSLRLHRSVAAART